VCVCVVCVLCVCVVCVCGVCVCTNMLNWNRAFISVRFIIALF